VRLGWSGVRVAGSSLCFRFIDSSLNVCKMGNNSRPWPLHSKHENFVLAYIPPNTNFSSFFFFQISYFQISYH